MKKTYEKPNFKAIEIQAEQFIATSGDGVPAPTADFDPNATLESDEQYD